MQNCMFRKGLVIGIIFLFIGILFIPEINANDNFTDDVDDKSIDNFEFRTEDDYEEIITLVRGEGHTRWINRKGRFRGSLHVEVCSYCGGVKLSGLKRSNGFIERYKYKMGEREEIVIPNYIGIVMPLYILGIAIGDIE